MKKFFLLASLFVFSLYLGAQDTATVLRASKEISKELTPQQVVDSLQKRFPNAQAVQYYKTPKEGVENGWRVSDEDDLAGRDLEYYTLKFKNDKILYYGLYSADGTLIRSKLDQKEAALPEAVKTSLKNMAATDYKGWKLLSSSYHKTIDYEKHNTYYEVTAIKGTETKTLIMSEDGKVIKEKY